MNRRRGCWLIATAIALLYSLSHATLVSSAEPSIIEVLSTSSSHGIFTQLLNTTGLAEILDNVTLSLTLFAPTDGSFALLQPPYYNYVKNEDDAWYLHLLLLLTYHVVTEMLDVSQIFALTELPTPAQGFFIPVDTTNKTIDRGATIVTADLTASNGYIQVPSRVLMPDIFDLSVADTIFNSVPNNQTSSSTTSSIISGALGNVATDYSIFMQIFDLAQTVSDVRQTLLSTLSKDGVTLFLPPDSAFVDVGRTTISLLLNQSNLANQFVLNHITAFNAYPVQPTVPFPFEMANGLTAWYSPSVDYLARVNTADITAYLLVANGVINVIDQVLIPSFIGDLLDITTSVGAYNFSTFLDIVQGPANITGVLYFDQPLTLFAPLNSAFSSTSSLSSLLTRLTEPVWIRHLRSLVFHHFTQGSLHSNTFTGQSTTTTTTSLLMVSGFNTTVQGLSDGNITIQNTNVVISDLFAFNGVIYGIDEVLLPASVVDSIYTRLEGAYEFSILSSLIRATNLTNLLNNTQGPLTMLAPNNTAFAAVGNLSNYSTASIQAILMGHIFEGNIFLEDLPTSSISEKWNVSGTKDGNVTVGGALVVKDDILASNGVIQIIKSVLLSPTSISTTTPMPSVNPTPPSVVATPTPAVATSSPASTPVTSTQLPTISPATTPANQKTSNAYHLGITTQQNVACMVGITILWTWFCHIMV